MWSNGQTLRRKGTNTLVRLHPSPGDQWAWDLGPNTVFINEDGTEFKDHHGNYTHVEDELGRAVSGYPIPKGEFIGVQLKKYLVSKKELKKMREETLLNWERKVLEKIFKFDYCPNLFIDGSFSTSFEKWFLKRRGAVRFIKVFDKYALANEEEFHTYPWFIFNLGGKTYIYQHNRRIELLDTKFLVENLKKLNLLS